MTSVGAAAPARRLMVTSAIALWGATATGLVASIARGKVSAITLGADGMGLIAQLNYLSLFLTTIAVLGLSNGCIRLLAEARATGDLIRERRVRSIVLFFPVAAGVVVGAGVFVAAPVLDRLLLGDDRAGALMVVASTIPAAMLTASFVIVLQGAGRMRRLAVANTIAVVVGTTLVIASILAFELTGAIAGIAVSAAVSVLVYAARERTLFAGVSFSPRVLFDVSILRAIYAYGLASVVLAIASSLLDLSLRTYVVHALGVAANGLYQPVSFLSTQFFLGLITALSMYLFPTLTGRFARGEHAEAVAEVNEGLLLLLAAVVPAVLGIVAFASPLLSLAFAPEFVDARPALGWQLTGEVLRAGAWTVGAVLLPLGLVRTWFVLGIATLGVQAGLAFVLIPVLDLEGLSLAYASAWAFNLAAAVVLARRSRVALTRESAAMLLVGIVFAAGAAALTVLSPGAAPTATIALLLGWLLLFRGTYRHALAVLR